MILKKITFIGKADRLDRYIPPEEAEEILLEIANKWIINNKVTQILSVNYSRDITGTDHIIYILAIYYSGNNRMPLVTTKEKNI